MRIFQLSQHNGKLTLPRWKQGNHPEVTIYEEQWSAQKYIYITRRQLFKIKPNIEKYALSSKSLHISSITEIASHQGIEFFERNYSSGYNLGTNQEMYLSQNILTLTLKGV